MSPRSLLLLSIQEPTEPAFLPSLENLMVVSLLIILSECFWIALLIGRRRYSFVLAMFPPITMSSGLKRLISPAIALPSTEPISSITSIARTSSSFAASMISSMWIFSPLLYFSESIEVLPSLSFSIKILYTAEPCACL